MQNAMGFNNIATVYIKENAYRIYFWCISRDDAIDIMNGSNFLCFINFFFIIYKNERIH